MARGIRIWLFLAVLACATVFVAVWVGSSRIPATDVIWLIFHGNDSAASEVIHRLRVPRAMAAFATGGLLALAGALMQVLLRNPLADPYVLGLSGGAAVGALAAMILGFGSALIDSSAF